MPKILSWLVYSSANPERISVTLKAGIAAFLWWYTMIHGSSIVINNDIIAQITASASNFFTELVQVILDGITLAGLIRKVYLSIKKN